MTITKTITTIRMEKLTSTLTSSLKNECVTLIFFRTMKTENTNKFSWSLLLKVLVAVLTALAGALGLSACGRW
jgi:hypothetical protein